MRNTARALVLLLLAAGASTSAPTSRPAPGSSFTIAFPDMPPTLANQLDNARVGAQMTVYLPTDYDPGRKHPLLLFLAGGSGGTAGDPSVARALSQEKDFVCVSLPLFKEKLDPPTARNGVARILVRDEDGRFAWPLYKRMLARLDEAVPNLDPAHQVIGGFSNGAHMTAALVNATDGEAAARFSGFFLVDGGGGLQRFDLLKGKPLLDVCGRWRPNPAPAATAGVMLSVYYMKVPEHAFPPSEYPTVREWLAGRLGVGIQGTPAGAEARLKVGDRAPDFRLLGTDGKEYSLGQFAGRSAVALCWYLRAGSSGSRTQLAAVEESMKELSKYRLQVLGVTLGAAEANTTFAAEMALSFPLLTDPDVETAKAYGTVRATSGAVGPLAERWVFLIDDQGVIRGIDTSEDVLSKGKLLLKAVEDAQIPAK